MLPASSDGSQEPAESVGSESLEMSDGGQDEGTPVNSGDEYQLKWVVAGEEERRESPGKTDRESVVKESKLVPVSVEV